MKKILLTLLILGVVGGAYGFYLSNKPIADVNPNKVDITVSAEKLINAFKDDESAANTEYLNRVILVSGIVKSVKMDGDTKNLLIDTGDLMSSVSCEMSKKVKSVKVGDMIKVKGQCTGYLLDVVLTKCTIQN